MTGLKILQGLILLSSVIYAGGNLNYIENYERQEQTTYEKVLTTTDTNIIEEVEIVEEAYVVEDNEKEGYIEPIIEEYNGEITTIDTEKGVDIYMSNAINPYGFSQDNISSNSETPSTIEESSTNRSISPIIASSNQNRFYAGIGISANHYTNLYTLKVGITLQVSLFLIYKMKLKIRLA